MAMLENFQLAAIVKGSGRTRLRRVPLHQDLQRDLSRSWREQYDVFMDDKQEIDFDAGYTPETQEVFRISSYEPPDWLRDQTSTSVPDIESIADDDQLLGSTKGLAAFAILDCREIVMFQNFVPSHVIEPGRFLFLDKGTYASSKRRGLTLDAALSAVLYPADNKLMFSNFRITNTFLPLSDYYKEATEHEIREILKHERLAVANADALAVNASQWFRKRFALLRESDVLDRFTTEQIRSRATAYDVQIRTDRDRIVFPAEKGLAKKLLQFLNEEIFRGAITETLYETNSKRRAG